MVATYERRELLKHRTGEFVSSELTGDLTLPIYVHRQRFLQTYSRFVFVDFAVSTA